MAETDAHNVAQDIKIEHLEQRMDKIETLAITLAENQQQAQVALTELSASVKAQNELVTEAWRGIRKGAPVLLAILLGALGLGSQAGVM